MRAELRRIVGECRTDLELCHACANCLRRALIDAGCAVWSAGETERPYARLAAEDGAIRCDSIERLAVVGDVIQRTSLQGDATVASVVLPWCDVPLCFGAVHVPLRGGEAWVAGIWSSTISQNELQVFLELLGGELSQGAHLVREGARLREAAATGDAIIHSAPVPIMSIDDGARVLFWNRACERLFRRAAVDVIGRTLEAAHVFDMHAASGYLKLLRQRRCAHKVPSTVMTALS